MLKILALLLLINPVFADSLVINLASRHADTSKEHNERNLGIGYKTDKYEVGFFKNSEWDRSWYLFRVYENEGTTPAVGIKLGGAIGYEDFKLRPVALPYIAFGKDTRLVIGILPVVITLSLEVKF